MPAQNKLYFCQTIDKNEGFPCPFFHICCTFFMPPSKMTFFNPTNRENSFQKFCNFVGFKPWKKRNFFSLLKIETYCAIYKLISLENIKMNLTIIKVILQLTNIQFREMEKKKFRDVKQFSKLEIPVQLQSLSSGLEL